MYVSDSSGTRVRDAALQEVVLTGRAVELAARSRCRSTLQARRSRTLPRLVAFASRSDQVGAARIARQVEQVEALRGEQLDDVRRTHRTLIAAAELDVQDQAPSRAPNLVRVGQ